MSGRDDTSERTTQTSSRAALAAAAATTIAQAGQTLATSICFQDSSSTWRSLAHPHVPCSSSQPCPRVSSPVRMCTSTSLGGRIGRASGRALVRLRLEALPPSWTCLSTRSRRRPRWRTSPPNVVRRAGSAGQMLHSGAASSQVIKCAISFNFHTIFTVTSRVPALGSIRCFGRCWRQGIQMFYDRKWCRG